MSRDLQGATHDEDAFVLREIAECEALAEGQKEFLRRLASSLAQSASGASRFSVLNEVHQRLHDMKNLQRASAWPHVEGVARAEKMVWDMIVACQPKDSEPFTVSATGSPSRDDIIEECARTAYHARLDGAPVEYAIRALKGKADRGSA